MSAVNDRGMTVDPQIMKLIEQGKLQRGYRVTVTDVTILRGGDPTFDGSDFRQTAEAFRRLVAAGIMAVDAHNAWCIPPIGPAAPLAL